MMRFKFGGALVPLVTILYFLFPLPVAWLSLSLTGWYMKYYDIGINFVVRSWELFYFMAPLLLIVLYGTAALGAYLANRFFKSWWLGMLLGGMAVFVVGIAVFAVRAWSWRLYPGEESRDMAMFLKYYVEGMLDLFRRR